MFLHMRTWHECNIQAYVYVLAVHLDGNNNALCSMIHAAPHTVKSGHKTLLTPKVAK